jgi:hypothetical protein
MSTYDFDKVLYDYEHDRITVEMAMGHSLQHIGKLYATQTTARTEWRSEIDALKKQVNLVQAAVDRLHGLIEKARIKQKSRIDSSQPKPD